MLIVGSRAMVRNNFLPKDYPCKDLDIIGTEEEYLEYTSGADINSTTKQGNTNIVKLKSGLIIEWELAVEGNTGYSLLEYTNSLHGLHIADMNTLYMLKMSHRYKKDSPHFLKTMRDVKLLRSLGAEINNVYWFEEREKETYKAQRPKLNVSKGDFFKDDNVPYEYDHDSIHEAVSVKCKPAYTNYIKANEDVMCSKERFNACAYETKLLGVVEEAMVLSLERSLIPNNFNLDESKIFRYALMKVCTSICSGWFREFAWENYEEALTLFESLGEGYMENKFKEGKNKNTIKCYRGI